MAVLDENRIEFDMNQLTANLARKNRPRTLQGDAGGMAVGYVDLDFQVPPVCPLALPIQP